MATAYPIQDPNELLLRMQTEIDGEPLQTVLPKARAMLTNKVQPAKTSSYQSDPISSYRSKAADIYSQASELYNREPDMAAIEEFARTRSQGGNAAMLNALAAQFAGEQFQPVQAQYLKRAAAAQDPIKFGSGMMTPSGQYIRDPEAMQNKKAEFLMQQARAYEQMALTAQTAQERAQTLAMQQAFMNDLRAQQLQLNRDRMGQGQVGSFTPSGYTPDGRPIVTNSKNGMSYIISMDPNGVPSYTPYQGQSVPKASWEKMTGEASDFSGSAFNADRLIKKVEANPAAFGLRGAAVGALPAGVQGYASKAVGLTPEEMKARSDILRESAMEINRLYGAALSLGEQARAASFVPDAKDPPEMVITKLQAARDWAQEKLNRMPSGVQKAAVARTGSQAGESDDPLGLRKQ